MGIMLNSVQGILDDAKKHRWQRSYYAFNADIKAMIMGLIQSILESDYTPKAKNIEIMKTLVEADMLKDVLFDNIHEGTINYNKTYISGMEYDK